VVNANLGEGEVDSAVMIVGRYSGQDLTLEDDRDPERTAPVVGYHVGQGPIVEAAARPESGAPVVDCQPRQEERGACGEWRTASSDGSSGRLEDPEGPA
jgi:hypothetical protein